MKLSLCLVVLSTLVATQQAAVLSTARASLFLGYIAPGDRLLHRSYLYRQAVPNTYQTEDLVYRGNISSRITAIQASEVGYSQYANIWLLSGGIGQRNVTLRAQSARGYGYYYLVDIWGR